MATADLPPLQGVHFSPAGDYIAAHAADAGMVALWHADTGSIASEFCRHHGAVLSLCWLSDNSFATCGQDGAVHINSVKLLPQGPAYANQGQDISMNDREEPQGAENGQPQFHVTVAWQRNLSVNGGHVNDVCCSSDGMWLAVGCDDGSVRAFCMVWCSQSDLCDLLILFCCSVV
jgi:WD40 repeat protein